MALTDAKSTASQLQADLAAGDAAAARRTTKSLIDQTGTAHAHTRGPLWALLNRVPGVGDEARAVQTSARVLHVLAEEATPTLLGLADALQSGRLKPVNGKIDVAELERLAPGVRTAADATRQPAADMAQVPTRSLFAPLDGLLGQVQDQVAAASGGVSAAADALEILPGLLNEGTHRFLLLFQNNAEVRATGGMFGSVAVLEARNGRIRMVRQGSAGAVGAWSGKRPTTAKERELFGVGYGYDLRDFNLNPDFPRAAELAAGLVERNWGTKVDAVLAVDPVAMAQVLRGANPIALSNGATITAGNAVPALLNQLYVAVPDPVRQDELFEEAAKSIFDAFVGGKGDSLTMFRGLATAAGQGRVRVWSPRDDIAAAVDGTRVSGQLNPPDDRPRVGVYFNDGGSWKMSYYLRANSSAHSVSCTADGRQRIRTTTTISNVATPAVRKLPVFVSGDGSYTPRGSFFTSVRLYAPRGARFTEVKVGDRYAGLGSRSQAGRRIAETAVQLGPGETTTITTEILGAPGASGDVVVDATPDIVTTRNPLVFASSCR